MGMACFEGALNIDDIFYGRSTLGKQCPTDSD